MNKNNRYLSAINLFIFGTTLAYGASITDIPNPSLTEVKSIEDGKYYVVTDLKGLQYPLLAESNGALLVFVVDGKRFSISRADVKLADEHLVKPGCIHVSATLPSDARSASVKGSGDGC